MPGFSASWLTNVMGNGNIVLTNPELTFGDRRPVKSSSSLLQETNVSLWSSLTSNLRDAFSSNELPPLELTVEAGRG